MICLVFTPNIGSVNLNTISCGLNFPTIVWPQDCALLYTQAYEGTIYLPPTEFFQFALSDRARYSLEDLYKFQGGVFDVEDFIVCSIVLFSDVLVLGSSRGLLFLTLYTILREADRSFYSCLTSRKRGHNIRVSGQLPLLSLLTVS